MYIYKRNKLIIFITFNFNLWIASRTQATVPSPPATKILYGISPNKWHHSRAFTGSRSDKSIIWAGFSILRKEHNISAPSLFPDFLLAVKEQEYNYGKLVQIFIADVFSILIFKMSFVIKCIPITISGSQLGHNGGTMDRSCKWRRMLLGFLTTSILDGGIIISLNAPKSHI